MFDFPTNPPIGSTQTLPDGAVRTWDGVKWKATQGAGALSALVQDTPPSNPQPGQLWFDSSDPQLYIWFIDPTSAQWVIVAANAGGLTTDAPLDGNVYGRLNAGWTPINATMLGGPFLPTSGGSIGPLTCTRLNISSLPRAKPDGSPPAGLISGDVYFNGGFLCGVP